MPQKPFVPRKRAVVTAYLDPELWHNFGLACTAHDTKRGDQVTLFIEETMHAWAEEDRQKEKTHGTL